MAEAQGWRIVWPKSEAEVDERARQLVATGRGSLRFVLGEADTRYRLLSRCIRWEQVALVMNANGEPGGFASFKQQGRGPYAPSFGDFRAVFGAASGCWRFVVFWLVEWRDWREEFYLYGLKVAVAHRRQGLAAMLLAAVEREAWARGAGAVSLEVGETNLAARELYAASGYLPGSVFELRSLSRFFSFSRLYKLRKPRPASIS